MLERSHEIKCIIVLLLNSTYTVWRHEQWRNVIKSKNIQRKDVFKLLMGFIHNPKYFCLRCSAGNACSDDSGHHRVDHWTGYSLHRYEVYHLWSGWQSAQGPHSHDRWHHHACRGSVFKCMGFYFFRYSSANWSICSCYSALSAIVACSWFAHNVIRAFYNPFTPANTK